MQHRTPRNSGDLDLGQHRQKDSQNHISEQVERKHYYCHCWAQAGKNALTDAASLLSQECTLPAATAPTRESTLRVCLPSCSRTVVSGVSCTPAARGPWGVWGRKANNWHFQLFQQEVRSAHHKAHKMRENPRQEEVQVLSSQNGWQMFPESLPFDCST